MAVRHTDLALEARQLWMESAAETAQLSGVTARETTREGYPVTTVEILDRSGAQALGKPVGRYITLELDGLLRRETDAFPRAVTALAEELRALLPADPREPLWWSAWATGPLRPTCWVPWPWTSCWSPATWWTARPSISALTARWPRWPPGCSPPRGWSPPN